jgi:hypothetical protein
MNELGVNSSDQSGHEGTLHVIPQRVLYVLVCGPQLRSGRISLSEPTHASLSGNTGVV